MCACEKRVKRNSSFLLFFFFCLKKYKRMSLYYLTSDPYLLWCWQQIHKTEPPYFFSLYHFLSEDKSKVPNISGFHFPAWAIACLRHWSVLKRCTVLHPEEDWCRLVKTLWTLINPVLPIDQVFKKKKKASSPSFIWINYTTEMQSKHTSLGAQKIKIKNRGWGGIIKLKFGSNYFLFNNLKASKLFSEFHTAMQ